jgi:hypothetical protein
MPIPDRETAATSAKGKDPDANDPGPSDKSVRYNPESTARAVGDRHRGGGVGWPWPDSQDYWGSVGLG